jgi:flagellar motor switch/type III secretory pathway protein FliN
MSAAAAVPTPVPAPATTVDSENGEARWQPVLGLPCELTVDLAIPDFKVRDFLALHSGSILVTHLGVARDVPLVINGVLIGWGELEGAGNRLSVRITELA